MNTFHFLLFNEDDQELSSIKQEECSLNYFPQLPLDPLPFIPYECSNLMQIISYVLNLNEEEVDWVARNQPIEFEMLMVKAKRKLYRERARNRTFLLQPASMKQLTLAQEPKRAKRGRKPLKVVEQSFESESEKHSDKKAVQMIRNRISAQNSRDRKKAYLRELESHTQQCLQENATLKAQIDEFEKKNRELSNQNIAVQKCIAILMKQCKKNSKFASLAQQLQHIQEDSDTNQEMHNTNKKVKI